MKKILLFSMIIVLSSCIKQQPFSNDWDVVLKTDRDGSVLKGSKKDLINAIRNGQDLKIGWGAKREDLSIEHLSSPIWLAILSEKEVMAHLDPQVLSNIDWDSLNVNYKDSDKLQQEWRVVLSTKSNFDAVWYDKKADTLIRRWPQKHIMTWFAKGPVEKNAVPLFNKS
ncbi:hypothetical protein DKG77_02490 [Flagellimonas aquimarina]|jgi:hypothetical protein|uniref:Lipoprotein n=1 Tax=Flagellimonas aquimarina TaxID=2201895 RepID=A0A316L1F6_9FLAO|nr:hypothetical protein [Allomuricauda koreensis]PWL39716.1 hypothetical protein DKG77_02490 [Allomuricauda koreensis]